MKLDSIRFQVDYRDGRTEHESRGLSYGKIDRENLVRFSMVDASGPLLILEVDDYRSGWNLIWRRRVTLNEKGEQTVMYLAGWNPMGPIFAVDQGTLKLRQAPMFIPGDPIFYPPQQHLHEGERWPVADETAIVNQSFERTK